MGVISAHLKCTFSYIKPEKNFFNKFINSIKYALNRGKDLFKKKYKYC